MYLEIVKKGKKNNDSAEWKMLQLATNCKDEMNREY